MKTYDMFNPKSDVILFRYAHNDVRVSEWKELEDLAGVKGVTEWDLLEWLRKEGWTDVEFGRTFDRHVREVDGRWQFWIPDLPHGVLVIYDEKPGCAEMDKAADLYGKITKDV